MAVHRDTNERYIAGQAYRVRTVTTTYTIDPEADDIIIADGTGGAFTITLPAAANANVYDPATGTSKVFTIVCISLNDVTVDGAGAETINGAANFLLDVQYERVALVSNGTAWFNV